MPANKQSGASPPKNCACGRASARCGLIGTHHSRWGVHTRCPPRPASLAACQPGSLSAGHPRRAHHRDERASSTVGAAILLAAIAGPTVYCVPLSSSLRQISRSMDLLRRRCLHAPGSRASTLQASTSELGLARSSNLSAVVWVYAARADGQLRVPAWAPRKTGPRR